MAVVVVDVVVVVVGVDVVVVVVVVVVAVAVAGDEFVLAVVVDCVAWIVENERVVWFDVFVSVDLMKVCFY